jgi:hypothetical protein
VRQGDRDPITTPAHGHPIVSCTPMAFLTLVQESRGEPPERPGLPAL